ncbi:unnamed protein product [Prorocentrum cordatum]|uniref:EF-hand domain-containing protein n=1 Tax=Prorocentrum cordatum TaxID=2364126 RepID=A0ABN9V308_9DINO|nr:unnamed protein product [Polarella glacialis]
MVLALVLNYGLKAYVEDLLIEEGNREDMFIYFGTFWRSFLSVIELTIGNWVPITRDLQELISPWLAFLVVIYRLIMEIAILKVVTGVFLHETFRVAKSDSELMIRGKMREDKLFKNKMASLFTEIDTDGNGKLSKDEFDNTFKHPRASLYLGALGLNYKDTEELWRLVVQEVGRSPEDSEVSTSDLERVIGKIRGEGRSIDVVMILQQVHHLLATLADSGVIRPLSDCSSPWIPTALPVHPSSGDSLDDCSPHLQDGRSAWGEAPSI